MGFWSCIFLSVFGGGLIIFFLSPFVLLHFIAVVVRYFFWKNVRLIPGGPIPGGVNSLTCVLENHTKHRFLIVVTLHHLTLSSPWHLSHWEKRIWIPHFMINIKLMEVKLFFLGSQRLCYRSLSFPLLRILFSQVLHRLVIYFIVFFVKLHVSLVDVLIVFPNLSILRNERFCVKTKKRDISQSHEREHIYLDTYGFFDFPMLSIRSEGHKASNATWWETLHRCEQYSIAFRMTFSDVNSQLRIPCLKLFEAEIYCSQILLHLLSSDFEPNNTLKRSKNISLEEKVIPVNVNALGIKTKGSRLSYPVLNVSYGVQIRFIYQTQLAFFGDFPERRSLRQIKASFDSCDNTPQDRYHAILCFPLQVLADIFRFYCHLQRAKTDQVNLSSETLLFDHRCHVSVDTPLRRMPWGIQIEDSRVLCIFYDDILSYKCFIDMDKMTVSYSHTNCSTTLCSLQAKTTTFFVDTAAETNSFSWKNLFKALTEESRVLCCLDLKKYGIEPLGITNFWRLRCDRITSAEAFIIKRHQLSIHFGSLCFMSFPCGLFFWIRAWIHLLSLFKTFKSNPSWLPEPINSSKTGGSCIRRICIRCTEIFGTPACHAGVRVCQCEKCAVPQHFSFFHKESSKAKFFPKCPLSSLQVTKLLESVSNILHFSEKSFLEFQVATQFSIEQVWMFLSGEEFPILPWSWQLQQTPIFLFHVKHFLFQFSPMLPSTWCRFKEVYIFESKPPMCALPHNFPQYAYDWLILVFPTLEIDVKTKCSLVSSLQRVVFLYYNTLLWDNQNPLRFIIFFSLQHSLIQQWSSFLSFVKIFVQILRCDEFSFHHSCAFTKIYPHIRKSPFSVDLVFHFNTVHVKISELTNISLESFLIYHDNDNHVVSLTLEKCVARTSLDNLNPPCFVTYHIRVWFGHHAVSREALTEHLEHFIDTSKKSQLNFFYLIHHSRFAVDGLHFMLSSHLSLKRLKTEFVDNFLCVLISKMPKSTQRDEVESVQSLKTTIQETCSQIYKSQINLFTLELEDFSVTFHCNRFSSTCKKGFFQSNNTFTLSSDEDPSVYFSNRNLNNAYISSCAYCDFLKSWTLKKSNFSRIWGRLINPIVSFGIETCFVQLRYSRCKETIQQDQSIALLWHSVVRHSVRYVSCKGFSFFFFKSLPFVPSPLTLVCITSTSFCILYHELLPNPPCETTLLKRLLVEHEGALSVHFTGGFIPLIKYVKTDVFNMFQMWSHSFFIDYPLHSNLNQLSRWNFSCFGGAVRLTWSLMDKNCLYYHNKSDSVFMIPPLLACIIPLFSFHGQKKRLSEYTQQEQYTLNLDQGFFVYVPTGLKQNEIELETCLLNLYHFKLCMLRNCDEPKKPSTSALSHWTVNGICEGPSLSNGTCCSKRKNEYMWTESLHQRNLLFPRHLKNVSEWTCFHPSVLYGSSVIPRRKCSLCPLLVNFHPSTFALFYRHTLFNDLEREFLAQQEGMFPLNQMNVLKGIKRLEVQQEHEALEKKEHQIRLTLSFTFNHIKCRFGLLRWNAVSMTLKHFSSYCTQISSSRADCASQALGFNSLDFECAFRWCSLAAEYNHCYFTHAEKNHRQPVPCRISFLPYVFLRNKRKVFISLAVFRPVMPSNVIPLLRLDSLIMGSQNTAECHIKIEGCFIMWNVLTIPALLASVQRWSLPILDFKQFSRSHGASFLDESHNSTALSFDTFLECYMVPLRCVQICVVCVNVQMNIHQLDVPGFSQFRQRLVSNPPTPFGDDSSSSLQSAQSVDFDRSDGSERCSDSSTRTFPQNILFYTSSKQDSGLHYNTNYRDGSLTNSFLTFCVPDTSLYNSISVLDALDLDTRQNMNSRRGLIQILSRSSHDDSREVEPINVSSLCECLDKVSLSGFSYLRNSQPLSSENIQFFLQCHNIWMLATEISAPVRIQENQKNDWSTFSFHHERLCRKVLRCFENVPWALSKGSYLETDVWTRCLQNKLWRMQSQRIKAYQFVVSSSFLEVHTKLWFFLQDRVHPCGVNYSSCIKTDPVLGYVGSLGLHGLVWRFDQERNGLTTDFSTSLCATRLLTEILRSRPSVLNVVGRIPLFSYVSSAHKISFECPILILSCSSESFEQLLWLIRRVITNDDVLSKRTRRTGKHTNPTVFLKRTPYSESKQHCHKKKTHSFRGYHSLLSNRKLQRHIASYLLWYRDFHTIYSSVNHSACESLASEVDINFPLSQTCDNFPFDKIAQPEICLNGILGQICFSCLKQEKVFCRCSITDFHCKLSETLSDISHISFLHAVRVSRELSSDQRVRFYLDVGDVLVKYLSSQYNDSNNNKTNSTQPRFVLAPLESNIATPVITVQSQSFTVSILDTEVDVLVKVYNEFVIKIQPLQVHLSPNIIEELYLFVFPTSRSSRETIDVVNPRFPLPNVENKSASFLSSGPPPACSRSISFKKQKKFKMHTYHENFSVSALTAVISFDGARVCLKEVPVCFKPFICSHKLGTVRKMIERYLWSLGRQTTTTLISRKVKSWVDRCQWKSQRGRFQRPGHSCGPPLGWLH